MRGNKNVCEVLPIGKMPEKPDFTLSTAFFRFVDNCSSQPLRRVFADRLFYRKSFLETRKIPCILHPSFFIEKRRCPRPRPRSQGRQPERCRCLRRLFGNSTVRHETFAERLRRRRHRHLGICPPFLRSESRKNRLKTQKNRSKLTSETVTMSNSLRVG